MTLLILIDVHNETTGSWSSEKLNFHTSKSTDPALLTSTTFGGVSVNISASAKKKKMSYTRNGPKGLFTLAILTAISTAIF
jgi:hypothetical protein